MRNRQTVKPNRKSEIHAPVDPRRTCDDTRWWLWPDQHGLALSKKNNKTTNKELKQQTTNNKNKRQAADKLPTIKQRDTNKLHKQESETD
jgi:hypothetical protein